MTEIIFQWIANHFPTHRMDENKMLASIWRALFYLIRPKNPFVMRTRHYRLHAHPKKGTLTRAVIRRGLWEQLETKAFLKLLGPGDVVVDAGANFGHYALTAAHVVGPEGLVLAFEPHPDVFALLEENRSLLPDDNLIAEQAGLGMQNITMEIYSDSANPGGHSFHAWNLRDNDGTSHHVPVYSLDSYLSGKFPERPIKVIKIDVQGFEMDVLKGAIQTIDRDRPAVLCEVTPEALQKAESGVNELLHFFEGRSYKAILLLPDQNREVSMTFSELEGFFLQSNAEYHDVLFLP